MPLPFTSMVKGTETLDRAHGQPSLGSGLPSSVLRFVGLCHP